MNSLTVVKPVRLTPAMLIACNVPETDHPAWSVSTTYAVGARVIDDHLIYQSLVAGNVGHKPALSPEQWSPQGSTNRWRAWDSSVSSQTAAAGLISYEVEMGVAINYIAFLNLSAATSVRVRVTHPRYGGVFDKSVAIRSAPLSPSWWQWYFGERSRRTQVLMPNLNAVPGSRILIDITGGSGLAVGVILAGVRRDFSMGVLMGASVGIQDYSRKERTDWGDTVIVERPFANRARFPMMLRAREVDAFKTFLAGVRATSCLWVGSDRYESTTVYGFYKSFDILINYYEYSDCEMELEGLT